MKFQKVVNHTDKGKEHIKKVISIENVGGMGA